MSALDLLRKQMFGQEPQAYQPSGKLAIMTQELINLVAAQSTNPLIAAVTASSRLVVRKLDDVPEPQQLEFLDSLIRVLSAAANTDMPPADFRVVLTEEAPRLQRAVTFQPK